MALTKTQINYLSDKLQRAVNDKISDYSAKVGTTEFGEELVTRLKAGKVKLLPKADLLKAIESNIKTSYGGYYYNPSINIRELISAEDCETIDKIVDENKNKVNDYTNKLNNAKQDALDKIVLEGVNFETAMAELDNIR